MRGSVRLTVAGFRLLRKVPPPPGHAAIRKYGWRESRQWHRNDTACPERWYGRAFTGETCGNAQDNPL